MKNKRTLLDVFNSMNDTQKRVLYFLVGRAIDDHENPDIVKFRKKDDENGATVNDVIDTLTVEQYKAFERIISEALKDYNKK